jgi:hypothetical protein
MQMKVHETPRNMFLILGRGFNQLGGGYCALCYFDNEAPGNMVCICEMPKNCDSLAHGLAWAMKLADLGSHDVDECPSALVWYITHFVMPLLIDSQSNTYTRAQILTLTPYLTPLCISHSLSFLSCFRPSLITLPRLTRAFSPSVSRSCVFRYNLHQATTLESFACMVPYLELGPAHFQQQVDAAHEKQAEEKRLQAERLKSVSLNAGKSRVQIVRQVVGGSGRGAHADAKSALAALNEKPCTKVSDTRLKMEAEMRVTVTGIEVETDTHCIAWISTQWAIVALKHMNAVGGHIAPGTLFTRTNTTTDTVSTRKEMVAFGEVAAKVFNCSRANGLCRGAQWSDNAGVLWDLKANDWEHGRSFCSGAMVDPPKHGGLPLRLKEPNATTYMSADHNNTRGLQKKAKKKK